MKESITIEVRGAQLTFRQRVWDRRYMRPSQYSQAPRMYVGVTDETVLDNLMNRTRRPYNGYKTLIRASGISEILDISKLSWSQRAGCTCPCSPGFIINRQEIEIQGKNLWNFDVWAMLEYAPSVDERKAPRVLAGV
jgi:hypothetical protein